MIRLRRSLSLSAVCMAATFLPVAALSGCAIGAVSFPDASTNPGQTPLGTIQGSDFGGHAPLAGAHVYVLQPSVTTANLTSTGIEANAYAAQATSILTGSTVNGAVNPTAVLNTSDPGIPTTWYYQKTDLTGAFNISGDYTCTAGVPVYLYLYGGSPTYTSMNNTFDIKTITWSNSGAPYTVTMTLNTTGPNAQPIENAYVGEFMVMNSTFTSAGGTPLAGSDQVVIAGSGSTALSTTQFSFSYPSLPTGVTAGATYTETGSGQVTFVPTFNPSVVNLAVLGNCPNNGSMANSGAFTGASAIKYVYVNEVSTVAAAYAFRPFTFTPNTSNASLQTSCSTPYAATAGSSTTTAYYWNNATCIGTSSKNLAGLQNAANIAGQLYDITGSNLSTTYAGEGHIARSLTTNLNGIVPQANIDTIANIIAACVDSNNGSSIVGNTSTSYSNGQNTGISPQCNTLFTYATGNGVAIGSSGAGVQPYDTATAALNIARHPGGPPASAASTAANFMSNLYALPQANPPFAPSLASTGAGQPNDFTIGILYPQSLNSPYTNVAESVAIDNIGNAWVTAQNGVSSANPAYFYEMSPTGVRSNVQSQGNYIYGYVTIDTNENAWAGAAIDTVSGSTTTPGAYGFSYVPKSGTTTSSTVYPNPYTYSAGGVNSNQLESYTYAAVADSVGNVYFGNNGTYRNNTITGTGGRATDYIETLSGAASAPSTVTGTDSAQIPTFTSVDGGITHMAMQPIQSSPSVPPSAYIDYNNSDGNGTAYIGSVTLSTGAQSYAFTTNATSTCSGLTDPEQMAVTRNGDGIFPDYNNGHGTINTASSSLYFLTTLTTTGSGTCATISGATVNAGLLSPFGAAVDGNNYAYITNRGNNNGTTISVLSMNATPANIAAVSPSTGLQPSYVASGGSSLSYELNGPLNIASGPSGELWITNPAGNSLVEIIGLAYPTVTPLAAGTFTTTGNGGGTVGTRP
jgi:hypothetical protein